MQGVRISADRYKVLYAGSAGALSTLPFQALCEAGFCPCAVVVDAGSDALAQRQALPVVTEGADTLPALALANELPLLRLSADAHEAAGQISRYAPDIMIVSCFARRLPEAVCAVPRLGCFNLHPSLLPAFRGPSPVFWQFHEGVNPMGVTLHRMSAQLDAGDIVAQTTVTMADGISLQQAGRLLAEAGGRLLVEALSRYGQGKWKGHAQREEQSSYQGFPTQADYAVSTDWPAQRLFNFMRATCGPGIVYPCLVDGRAFRLVEALRFQASGTARFCVQGDQLVLPCCPGFVHARFLTE
ncbi:MAG TPA: hypothetical protein ENK49_01605 [Gammaproteobacteria bacterium]|nr:hypothetical protein [Gammaproteobacteria bacterium]